MQKTHITKGSTFQWISALFQMFSSWGRDSLQKTLCHYVEHLLQKVQHLFETSATFSQENAVLFQSRIRLGVQCSFWKSTVFLQKCVASFCAISPLQWGAENQWQVCNNSEVKPFLKITVQVPYTFSSKHVAMDWFKGTFTSLSPMFNGKIYGFRLQFSLKPIHWM